MGDVFRPVPYVYRNQETKQLAEAPVLAVCTQHPCDAPLNLPKRVNFARAFVLDEYLMDNPRAWQALPAIAAGRHFDLCLLPASPGRWEVDLIVDLADQFSVDAADARLERRLAGLNEGYWQTFGWYVARRAARAGVTHAVPSFDVVVVGPQHDQIPRPMTIPLGLFDVPLRAGEAAIRPRVAPPLTLTHLRRPAAEQDWWKAEWKGISWVAGYGLSLEAAMECLVRAVRRLVADLPTLATTRPAVATEVRRACQAAGALA